MKQERNPIEAILDEKDDSNITLYNDKKQPIELQQVATIILEETIYAILQPVIMPKGADPDEALVFVIEELPNDQARINLVTDDDIIDEVFDAYEKLYNEQVGSDK